MKRISLSIVLGLALACLGTAVYASRNASGTYTLPAGNPVVTRSLITTAWANNTLGDLAGEMTNSLDRTGKGAMQAPLMCVDGTVGAPALSFSNAPDSGLYRSAVNTVAMSGHAVKGQDWTATATTTYVSLVTTAGFKMGASGTSVSASYGNSYTIDFPILCNGANACCALSTQTLTGVAVGGVCTVSPDTDLSAASTASPVTTDCFVSGADTIKVRACGSAAIDPASATFRVRVFQP